jgi:hypothetical protein
MREVRDGRDGNAARGQRIERPCIGCARHARHLGHADAIGPYGDQIRKRATDLDADSHEGRSPEW